MTAHGAILYWHTQLATLGQCSGADLIASLVPDDANLEVLVVSGQGFQSTVPQPPYAGCTPSPVQIAGVDADGDGLTDLAVLDTSCGNWIARQSADCTFTSHPWKELLPDLPAMPWFVVRPQSGGEIRSALAAGWSFSVAALALPDGGAWRSAGEISFASGDVGQTFVSTGVQFMADPQTGTDTLLLQRGNYFTMIAIGAAGDSLGPSTDYQQAAIEPPYVKPFLAFDQLLVMSTAACGQLGLGFGIFAPKAGIAPHRLQAITFSPDGYRAKELVKSDGYSLAWRRSVEGVDHVAVTAVDGSRSTVSLYTLDGCEALAPLASADLPPQSVSSPTRARLNNGLVFLTQESGNLPVTFTYDGTKATVCATSASGMTCSNLERL
jgi:hypothetical protein